MTNIEGVDWSRGAFPGVANLKAHGKHFAGRYAVSDKSPSGRGITATEYQALTNGGIETFLYWEGSASWMLGGFNAGVAAAQNAQANINAAGMPHSIPVYFAHDIEPQPQHYAAIDACLKGAASVMGAERIGVYGGRYLIDHCRDADTAKWFCETEAWSYVNHQIVIAEGVHILQYGTTKDTGSISIGGTNVDLCRALKPIYGQASAFLSGPPIVPHDPKTPTVPWDKDDTGPQKIGDTPCLAFLCELTAKKDVEVRVTATRTGKGFHTIKAGERVTGRGSTRNKSGLYYFVDLGEMGVGRAVYSSFFDRFPLP